MEQQISQMAAGGPSTTIGGTSIGASTSDACSGHDTPANLSRLCLEVTIFHGRTHTVAEHMAGTVSANVAELTTIELYRSSSQPAAAAAIAHNATLARANCGVQ